MISLTASLIIIIGTFGLSILYILSVQPASLAMRIGGRAYKLCGVLRMAAMIFEMFAVAGYVLFIFGDEFNYVITEQHITVIRLAGVLTTVITLGFTLYSARVAGWEAAVPNKESKLYSGIYNYMRHPQTLGEMLSWFGIAMILNSLTLLIYSVIWIPLFISYTVVEDNDLSVRFGEDYINYAKKVGMFRRKKAGKISSEE